MRKYEVGFRKFVEGFVTVDAEDEDAARDQAYDLLYHNEAVIYHAHYSDIELLAVDTDES